MKTKQIMRTFLAMCAAIGILSGCGEGTGNAGSVSNVEEGAADIEEDIAVSSEKDADGEHESSADTAGTVMIIRTSSGFSLCRTDGTVIKSFEGSYYRGYPSEGKFLVEEGGKLGVMDFGGNFVIEPQYDAMEGKDSIGYYEVLQFSEGMAIIKENGLYGFINEKGETVIAPQFDYAHTFSCGLACVKSGEKYGYIDHTGNFVIEPTLDSARSFSHGLAQAEINGSWGIINQTGELVQEENVSPVSPIDQENGNFDFHDGLAVVEAGQYYGYINEAGEMAIEPVFKEANPFVDGIACVKVYVEGHDVYGYINTSGEYVIEPQYAEAKSFSEGLAYVRRSTIDGRPDGYIDPSGNCVIEVDPSASLVNASEFSEGMAFVIKPTEDGSYPCYIDTAGNEMISLDEFDASNIYNQGSFENGYAVIMTNDNHFGLIDREGNVIFEPEYSSVNADYIGSDGIVILSLEDGRQGAAALDGSWIIEPDSVEISVLKQESEEQ